MGLRPLIITLAVLAAIYVLMDVGLDRSRLFWTVGLCGLVGLWLALSGALIGGVLWGLERGCARWRGRGPVPGLPEFRLYAGIGAGAVFGLLVFRHYAFAFG